MKKALRVFLFSALLGWAITSAGQRSAFAGGDSWGESYLPDLPVVTQNGETLKFYSGVLKDKITVISFIYTTCRDICPLVTARLADVQDRLGDSFGRDIQFVSISIDPKTDTPERMKEHAAAFGAKPGWLFLTGNSEDIDIIRYKLGERSRIKTEHRSEILIRNDKTGEWARDSAFGDLSGVVNTIRSMDPVWRASLRADPDMHEGHARHDLGIPGQALFLRACGACHTIGKGDKVGPDLKNVSNRRTRDWLKAFLASPETMRAKGDATALELRAKFKGVQMPNLGLADNDIADVLAYVEAQSHADTLAAKDSAHSHEHTHDHRQTSGQPEEGHHHH